MISRHLDPIINSCYVIKYIICGLQMGVSVPSGCFSIVYKHDKGVSFQRQRNYSLIVTVPANATRSTSGFKQTVVNSG